ncbi:hypothetical protein C4D60_Mb00t01080 [Musa balbisiana]|uniref:Uncharacterized protein n=1 Tax=Musa balbisiana TaxID=52838 RepID=A0A4S8I6G7_MUSBA|nr:hypothetical protein C4D60_Mb00t01080 [Musa balbisiana]
MGWHLPWYMKAHQPCATGVRDGAADCTAHHVAASTQKRPCFDARPHPAHREPGSAHLSVAVGMAAVGRDEGCTEGRFEQGRDGGHVACSRLLRGRAGALQQRPIIAMPVCASSNRSSCSLVLGGKQHKGQRAMLDYAVFSDRSIRTRAERRGRLTDRLTHPTEGIAVPSLPRPGNFKHSLTLFSKDERTGLSPSPAHLSGGLGPRSVDEEASPDTIRTTQAADSSRWADPETLRGITRHVIASTSSGLNGHSPSKKLAAEGASA